MVNRREGWPHGRPARAGEAPRHAARNAATREKALPRAARLWHLARRARPPTRARAPWTGLPPEPPTPCPGQRRGRSPRRCTRSHLTEGIRADCTSYSPRCCSRPNRPRRRCPHGRLAFRERNGVIGCRSHAGHASCSRRAAVSDSQWLRSSGPGGHRQGVPRLGHRTLHPGICSRGMASARSPKVGAVQAGGNAP